MYCGHCGTYNTDDSRFCMKCGASLQPAVQNGAQGEVPFVKAAGPAGNGFATFLKKRWMILAPVLLIVIVALLCMNSIIMLVSPTLSVNRAADHTKALLDERFKDSAYAVFRDLGDSLKNGSIRTDISYDDGSGTNISGDLTVMSDLAQKDYAVTANVALANKNIDLTLLSSSDRLAFFSSLIDDSFYGVTYDTFNTDFRKFAEVAGIDDETVKLIQEAVDNQRKNSEIDYTKLLGKYDQLFTQFVKALKPETSSDTITMNGADFRCSVVTYTVTEAELDKLLRDFYTIFSNDAELRDYIISYMETQSLGNGGLASSGYMDGYSDPQAFYDQILKSFKDAVDSFGEAYSGTLKAAFYIGGGNKLVRVDISGDPEISGDKLDFDFYVDFGKNPDRDDLSVNLTAGGRTVGDVVLKLALRSENKSGVLTDLIELNSTISGSSESMSFKSEWAKSSGDLSLTFDAGADMVRFGGNLKFAGTGFVLKLDDLLDALDAGDLDVMLTAEKGAKIPNPEYINLDKWDQGFVDKIKNAVNELIGTAYQDENLYDF
jgi:hypothetical protein